MIILIKLKPKKKNEVSGISQNLNSYMENYKNGGNKEK